MVECRLPVDLDEGAIAAGVPLLEPIPHRLNVRVIASRAIAEDGERRDHRSRVDDGSDGDDRALADRRIEVDRVCTEDGAIAERAVLDDGAVGDDCPPAGGDAAVDDRVVLDDASGPDDDRVHVGADDGTEPDAGVLPQRHAPDHPRARRDERRGGHARSVLAVGDDARGGARPGTAHEGFRLPSLSSVTLRPPALKPPPSASIEVQKRSYSSLRLPATWMRK